MIRPGIRRLFRLPLRGRGARGMRARELEEEIELHLELRTERLVAEGWPHHDARAEALRRFGRIEDARRALGRSAWRREERLRLREWFHGLLQDGRHGLRRLRRSPGFAVVAVLTVALGVGATTAVFGVVRGVLLRPLPYAEADRVYYLWERSPEGESSWVSAPNFRDWRGRLESFDAVAALTPGGFNVSGYGGPERIRGVEVTPELFRATGMRIALGRGFLAEEGAAPARVAVISDGLWRRQFGGDSAALGRMLELDGMAYPVVGVLAPDMEFPRESDVWVPLDLGSEGWKARRGIQWLNVVARLRPGFSLESALSELELLSATLAAEHGELEEGSGIAAVPLVDEELGQVRPPLLILSGAVGVVLLVVCVNLAGLLLVRAGSRRKEAAIRRAIGCGRGRLLGHGLAEAVLVCALGGVLGVAFAFGAVRLLQVLAPGGTPRIEEAAVNGPVLVFAITISVTAALLSGLIPALREAATDPRDGLDPNTLPVGGAAWSRNALVVAQVALAVVLVTGAAHLLETFRNLRAVDPGFRTEGVLTAWLPLSETHYPNDAAVEAFYREVLRRVEAEPGVAAAGVVSVLPLGGGNVDFSFELRDGGGDERERVAGYQSASAGYFDAMGIPLLRGRGFRAGEGRSESPVVVVDEAFARRFFPGLDPLDQEILAVGDEWRRVVGVVGTVRRRSLRSEPEPMFYVPLGQDPRDAMTLVIRAAGDDATALGSAVRRAVTKADPAQPVARLGTLESLVGEQLDQPRFTATVLGFFGAAALFLAMLGVYGTVSQMVERRSRELGIRMALGAAPGHVRGMVLGRAAGLVGAGLVVGMATAIPSVRLARSVFYDVSPFHAELVAAVVLLLATCAALASWLPARRATRLDPSLSLRREP